MRLEARHRLAHLRGGDAEMARRGADGAQALRQQECSHVGEAQLAGEMGRHEGRYYVVSKMEIWLSGGAACPVARLAQIAMRGRRGASRDPEDHQRRAAPLSGGPA